MLNVCFYYRNTSARQSNNTSIEFDGNNVLVSRKLRITTPLKHNNNEVVVQFSQYLMYILIGLGVAR